MIAKRLKVVLPMRRTCLGLWATITEIERRLRKRCLKSFIRKSCSTFYQTEQKSCYLCFQVEASDKEAEAITIYTVTAQGNPTSVRLQMHKDAVEVPNLVLLQQFESWFAAKAIHKLVRESL